MARTGRSMVVRNGIVLLGDGKVETCELWIQDGKITGIDAGPRVGEEHKDGGFGTKIAASAKDTAAGRVGPGAGQESRAAGKPASEVQDEVSVLDVRGAYVLPGLIDLHTHGIQFEHVDAGALTGYAQIEASYGATTFYPTLFAPPAQVAGLLRRHRLETGELKKVPQVGGFRLESPYLARTGAGLDGDLAPIGSGTTRKLLEAGGGLIRIWDVSPELAGAPDLIRRLTSDGIVCSMAHTRATIEQAKEAVDAGAKLVTHMFDTFVVPEMVDLGVYPVALVDYLLTEDRVCCEVIPDGTHVHPLLVEKAFRCKTPERIALITDSNYGAGLPSGYYTLPNSWGNVVIKGPNDGVRLANRDLVLAGSALTPINCFRNAVQLFGCDMATASRICSAVPARVMGLNKGEIADGRDADLIVLDSELELLFTIVGGAVVYRKGNQERQGDQKRLIDRGLL